MWPGCIEAKPIITVLVDVVHLPFLVGIFNQSQNNSN